MCFFWNCYSWNNFKNRPNCNDVTVCNDVTEVTVWSNICVPLAQNRERLTYNFSYGRREHQRYTPQYCPRCLSVWWRFVSDDLWNTVVCFQPPSLLIGKVWVPVVHFCVCHIHCRVHLRAGRRPGLCRSTSVLLLIGSTIREFSISSALWILEVLI